MKQYQRFLQVKEAQKKKKKERKRERKNVIKVLKKFK